MIWQHKELALLDCKYSEGRSVLTTTAASLELLQSQQAGVTGPKGAAQCLSPTRGSLWTFPPQHPGKFIFHLPWREGNILFWALYVFTWNKKYDHFRNFTRGIPLSDLLKLFNLILITYEANKPKCWNFNKTECLSF